MSDETATPRPRPQYGEYASPEEQASAIKVPSSRVPDAALHGAAHEERARRTDASVPPAPHSRVDLPPPAALTARPRWDVIVTTVLIALATYVIVSSTAGLLSLGETLTLAYEMNGYETFTGLALANSIGIAIVVIQSAAYVLMLVLTIRSTRAGRRSFHIPLIIGAAVTLVTLVLMFIAILSDPALAASIPQS